MHFVSDKWQHNLVKKMASFGNAGDSSQSENQDDLDSSAPATRLVENSALREAENEVISIITKVNMVL